jgi:hypothetical protein
MPQSNDLSRSLAALAQDNTRAGSSPGWFQALEALIDHAPPQRRARRLEPVEEVAQHPSVALRLRREIAIRAERCLDLEHMSRVGRLLQPRDRRFGIGEIGPDRGQPLDRASREGAHAPPLLLQLVGRPHGR